MIAKIYLLKHKYYIFLESKVVEQYLSLNRFSDKTFI